MNKTVTILEVWERVSMLLLFGIPKIWGLNHWKSIFHFRFLLKLSNITNLFDNGNENDAEYESPMRILHRNICDLIIPLQYGGTYAEGAIIETINILMKKVSTWFRCGFSEQGFCIVTCWQQKSNVCWQRQQYVRKNWRRNDRGRMDDDRNY